jgi:hypothetical protein
MHRNVLQKNTRPYYVAELIAQSIWIDLACGEHWSCSGQILKFIVV